jgi:DNA-binding transcriptional LysR family regulator
MIDPEQLSVFLTAAETLNFSETARQLNLSQPTVSKRIQELERGLNLQLFDRTSQLRLTEAGKSLLPAARKLIHQLHGLDDMMASLQTEVTGDLTIACSTTAGKYILPQLAARFCQRYPGIHVRILACLPGDVVPNLLMSEADLGVVSFEVVESGIEGQEFFDDSISLIVAANHPWAFRKSVEPGELLEEPIILRESTSGTRRVVLEQLAKHDISLDDLNIFLELGNAEAIVRTVASGYGIGFVSSLASACPLERGSIVDIPVIGFELRRKIYMMRKRLDAPHRPQEAFWSFVHDPSNADILQMAEHAN